MMKRWKMFGYGDVPDITVRALSFDHALMMVQLLDSRYCGGKEIN